MKDFPRFVRKNKVLLIDGGFIFFGSVHPYLGKDEPILTSIFFRWVETTNFFTCGLISYPKTPVVGKFILITYTSWCERKGASDLELQVLISTS